MPPTDLVCPNCHAPLPPSAESTVVCQYCGHVIADVPTVPWGSQLLRDPWRGRPEDEDKPRVFVADQLFVVLGRFAQGTMADLYLARRDRRLSELVVLKVLRDKGGPEETALTRAWKVLEQLDASNARGLTFFRRLLPQRVRQGYLHKETAKGQLTSVFRWRSGFVHSLKMVNDVFPLGVDPRAAVWMWRRMLDLLGWVHASGFVHGAVVPSHAIIHERDHGLVLTGWSRASGGTVEAGVDLPPSDEIKAFSVGIDVQTPSAQTDLMMSAKTIAFVLGGRAGQGTVPTSVPQVIADLVADVSSRGWPGGAGELASRVGYAAREAFGPPRYVPFEVSKAKRGTGGT